jgi:hypothetical protein
MNSRLSSLFWVRIKELNVFNVLKKKCGLICSFSEASSAFAFSVFNSWFSVLKTYTCLRNTNKYATETAKTYTKKFTNKKYVIAPKFEKPFVKIDGIKAKRKNRNKFAAMMKIIFVFFEKLKISETLFFHE